MARQAVTCTHDDTPTFAITSPQLPALHTNSSKRVVGAVLELGAGLSVAEWSLDGLTWTTLSANASGNYTIILPSMPDGIYTVRFRAGDRALNAGNLSWGPITV